jgi:hypothetical protein
VPNLFRERWAATSWLPTPEQLETFAMPTNESTRLDDHERCLPIESIHEALAAKQCGCSQLKKASCGQHDSNLRASARRVTRTAPLSKSSRRLLSVRF